MLQNHHGGHELWYYKAARVRTVLQLTSCCVFVVVLHLQSVLQLPPACWKANRLCLICEWLPKADALMERYLLTSNPIRVCAITTPPSCHYALLTCRTDAEHWDSRFVQELAHRHWYGLPPEPLQALVGTENEGLLAEHPCEWCAPPAIDPECISPRQGTYGHRVHFD